MYMSYIVRRIIIVVYGVKVGVVGYLNLSSGSNFCLQLKLSDLVGLVTSWGSSNNHISFLYVRLG